MSKESKAAENRRAYDRRRLRELAVKSGLITAEQIARESTRSIHKAYKKRVTVRQESSWAVAADRVNARTGMMHLEPRDWDESPEQAAEVRAILERGRN